MPFIRPSEMISRTPLPGWSGRFFHSDTMTFAHWDVSAGAADLHEHHHDQEEVWHVVDGSIALRIEGEECVLSEGMAAVVPSGARHSARVLGPCRAVVADYPLRLELPAAH